MWRITPQKIASNLRIERNINSNVAARFGRDVTSKLNAGHHSIPVNSAPSAVSWYLAAAAAGFLQPADTALTFAPEWMNNFSWERCEESVERARAQCLAW
jgi:hypothetical protein